MKQTKFLAAFALSAAAVLLAPGAATADDGVLDGVAPDWLDCALTWNDENTAGITCTGGAFIAIAQCANGQLLNGAAAAPGTTSYVYCTSVNSALQVPVLWDAVPA
ncbi:hypothetical protein ACFVMC_32635 [Nocardia sp. NPDC127579]|uniref:hypothetical protein n=1 Tax=Nocardia sp. NPDC127579 TaxID=3345402 RepID=UPI00362B705C